MINKKIVCVIPARLASHRFPKKLLSSILGKPILQWVFEAASKIKQFNSITFAIDSEETAKLLDSFNAPYIMTSKDCSSGTHRVIEVMKSGKIDGDIWVNWQGDEPFINSEMINNLLQSVDQTDASIWTLRKKIINANEINSPDIVKVVCDVNGNALYFSRSTIPFYRESKNSQEQIFFKHVGIYAFTTSTLQIISQMSDCYLENAELLEQLKFLYYGLKVKAHETNHEVMGIDRPEHIIQAEEYASKNGFV